MKKLIGLACGVFLLPLPAFSDSLAISATGRGVSESAAIAAAKRQAVIDTQAAGFLPQNGYRIGATRVVELTRVGASYVARVDANLVKDLDSKRVVFIVSGEEAQTPRLLSLVHRVRTSLAKQRSGNQPHIEVIDALATGALRISSLADLQRPDLDAELGQMTLTHRADALYLLSANGDKASVFLVSIRNEMGSGKTIRTLRDSNASPLIAQVTEAVQQDVGRISDADIHSVVTLPAAGVTVRKGQSVIIYADKFEEGGVRESSIVTHGIVTEVSGSKVRVLAEQPVATAPSRKLRLSPLPKQGVIITESDW